MSKQADVKTLTKEAKRYVRAGDNARAIKLLQQAISLDTDRADVHETLAAAYFRQREYEKAIEHFTAVLRLNPTEARSEVNIGAIYNRMGRYDQAVTSLRRGIQKDRKCGQAYYNLGLAYRGLNQLSMGVSAYREAIRLDPDMAEAYLNLANMYVDMGNHQQAILHYKKALEIKPEFERAERGLVAAEKSREQARNSISPFGRLVDVEKMDRISAVTMLRQLTNQERLDDRHQVNQLTVGATADTTRLLECLRKELEPSLMALTRAGSQVEETPTHLGNALPPFQQAVRNCHDTRATLKRYLDQLRSHQQFISDTGSEPSE
jgi:tetratricopeptide (TPR) repeat protein